jgi:hypothetical protein
MTRRIQKITVTAIGTPPPLPFRPLVDEILCAFDERRRLVAPAPDPTDTGRVREVISRAPGRPRLSE